MTLGKFLPLLDGVRQRGARWSARCPAHGDKSPSLSVSEGERGILLRCFAGCELREICDALGIQQKDLFFDTPAPHGHRPIPEPLKINRAALAFTWELGALDLRLRAERVLQASHGIIVSELLDQDLDRLVDAVSRAHGDIARAELFEGVADHLRLKEFSQRDKRRESHAA